jgi:hypothetical protein
MNYLLVSVLLLGGACTVDKVSTIDLSGEWQFKMDPSDQGETKTWFSNLLPETLHLPGSMVENGKGEEITLNTQWTGGVRNPNWHEDPNYAPYHDPGNIRFPYWLQPEKKYTGAAWYQKQINIPASWKNQRIELKLERCHWETTVWLDDQKIGTQNSLGTPHYYQLANLEPGQHTLTIRVDNRTKDIDPGRNSHSISDHTQSNWNGIVGEISLTPLPAIQIDQLRLKPNIIEKLVRVEATINNTMDTERAVNLQIKAAGQNFSADLAPLREEIKLKKGINTLTYEYALGTDARLWDEFSPNLYQLSFSIEDGSQSIIEEKTFGLREIKVEDNLIKINGRQVFLRGTLECAIFPKTGYPPTDKEAWRKIYQVVQEHGLNHVRFHSWCPPEAAFAAADEEGIYLQVECSSWANQSTTLGDGKPIDNFIWEESKRIVEEFGDHPSFCLMAYGNEPGGPNYSAFLADFLNYWKAEDDRRIYTSAAGWPAIPENEFHNIPQPRIQGWGEGLNSIINQEPPTTDYDWHSRNKMPEDGIPVVSHEIGQWCVYPNFKEIEKYTGVLKAKNFEIFKESLEANKMGHLADSFLLASGKLQALCYKADIEAALRTKDFGGFQLLDLHDFPGQGTALVGILDPFWEEKGYISPEAFSRFCNSVVPLARLDKRTFSEGETLQAKVEVANFGAREIKTARTEWRLKNEAGEIVSSGAFSAKDIPIGNGITLGTLDYSFQETGKPRKLSLEVSLNGFTNSWNIWVYPKKTSLADDPKVMVTNQWNAQTQKALEEGKKVILSLGKGKVKEGKGGEVGLGFSSIFWNTAWTDGQKPHTLGILCNPEHPALASFPTEYHSDWQWWDAVSHADVIKLNDFSEKVRPIVRVIDDWVSNRRLALLLEAKVGNGQLLISGIDLHSDLDQRIEARQLLHSLHNYVSSDQFNPQAELSPEEIIGLIK